VSKELSRELPRSRCALLSVQRCFVAAMDDDLNTSAALACCFDLAAAAAPAQAGAGRPRIDETRDLPGAAVAARNSAVCWPGSRRPALPIRALEDRPIRAGGFQTLHQRTPHFARREALRRCRDAIRDRLRTPRAIELIDSPRWKTTGVSSVGLKSRNQGSIRRMRILVSPTTRA